MLQIPAVCQHCGTIFSSGIGGENSTIVINNVNSGPCPNCGRDGIVPDGYYNLKKSIIDIVVNSSISLERIKSIIETINNIKKSNIESNDIGNELKSNVVEFNSLWDILLPKTRSEWYAFLAVIIAILNIFINFCQSSGNSNYSRDDLTSVLNEIVDEKIADQKKQPYIAPSKSGRNDLCSCGSGKKYKKCCGFQI